jgi:hypothetical protein
MSLGRASGLALVYLVATVFLCCPSAGAESILNVTGIAASTEQDPARADKAAFDDALYKAYLQCALKVSPSSSVREVADRLESFIAGRSGKDVIRFKILSRYRSGPYLNINYEITLDEEPLRTWLNGLFLTTPSFMMPKVLLAITTRGPRPGERHEWWALSSPSGYSPFESRLAERLRGSGQNVMDPPKRPRQTIPADRDQVLALGAGLGADVVVSGLLTHTAQDATMLNSRLDLYVNDVRSGRRLATTSVTLRGTVDAKTMNTLLVDAVIDQIKPALGAKAATSVSSTYSEKTLCIQGVRDNDQYQEVLSALRSLGMVKKITISEFKGQNLCHTLQMQGTLDDLMTGLRRTLKLSADMAVEDDEASIRILN